MAITPESRVPPELAVDAPSVATAIEAFISRQMEERRGSGAILGLSGGIDSAVVAGLAARALGPEKVLALIMPERDSAPTSEHHARDWATQLGIRFEVMNLTNSLQALGVYRGLPLHWLGPKALQAAAVRLFSSRLGRTPFARFLQVGSEPQGFPSRLIAAGRAYVNVKHRMRMVYWYYRAEAEKLLVLGSCNRTEKEVGFFVRYGDSAADIAPIEGLYKTQLFQLARYLGVPDEILRKPPSPDLLPGVTDEYALGMSYELLDRILYRLNRGMEPQAIARELGIELEQVDLVLELRRAAQPMRELPPAGPSPADGAAVG
jgi:NAD+ synthase